MVIEVLHLNLVSPLFYFPEENPQPFHYPGDGPLEGTAEEKLFCFELEERVYRHFEPNKEKLIKALIFGGTYAGPNPEQKGGMEGLLELPAGNYLFAQKRQLLDRESILFMAGEIQSEALWQRLKPGKKLYLRYLHEDNSMVTQLFRTIE